MVNSVKSATKNPKGAAAAHTTRPAPDPAVRRRGRPGAGQGKSKDEIVAIALKQLDEDGLELFSLRNVARELGVYPATIYWYFPNRGALLAEVVGHALRDTALPAPTSDWKGWLSELLHRSRQLVRKHPNMAPLIGSQMLTNSAVPTEMIEGILQALVTAGFEGEMLVEAYNSVIAAQVGFVTLELAQMPKEDSEAWRDELQQRLRTVDPVAHPKFAETLPQMANRAFCVRWSNGAETPLDASFKMFVDALILGLEAQSRRHRL